jgi:hypothetical protein
MKIAQEGNVVVFCLAATTTTLAPVIEIMTAVHGLRHVGDVLDPYRWWNPDVIK